MIAGLRGIIESVDEGSVVVDVSGVGYLVFCSARTRERLVVGEPGSLLVETQVRQDAIQLYGFRDRAERDCFRLLNTVQGVGAKVALAVLSVLSPDDLLMAIAAGDRAAVTRAAGVGPRLATRILSELKDKVGSVALGPAVAAKGKGAGRAAASAEAISALVNLGYSSSDAWRAVSEAIEREGASAGVETLIRAGLAILAPKEHRV